MQLVQSLSLSYAKEVRIPGLTCMQRCKTRDPETGYDKVRTVWHCANVTG